MDVPLGKRSVVVARQKTSVSLEDEFWFALREIARARRQRLSALVGEVDAARGRRNLSSAIRVFVLEEAFARAEALRRP